MLPSNQNIVIPWELTDKLVRFKFYPFANLNILIDSTFNFPCEYFKKGAYLMLVTYFKPEVQNLVVKNNMVTVQVHNWY
jgi:hypothetical protein